LQPPKGTSLRETASYELLFVKVSSVVFPVEDGNKKKRKGKERHKKSLKHYISPIRLEAPPWTDFHQILHIRRSAGRNHLCKFWCGKIKGFGKYEGSNFGVSHWNG